MIRQAVWQDRIERILAFTARHARIFLFLRAAIALGTGVGSVLLLRRGVTFAPAAAASLIVAWTLVAVVARYLPPNDQATRVRRIVRFLATGFIAGLYQDVLFFLIPVWAGSATWPSPNIIAPLVLGAMAVFSCFEEHYMQVMLKRPVYRALFSGVILFATLVAATPVLVAVPLRPSLAISALTSAALTGLAALPREHLRAPKAALAIVVSGALAAGFFFLIARALPPVPVSLVKSAAALRIEDREPDGAAETFPSGTPRIYAHFAVAAPEKFSDHVRFRWIHDGRVLQKELDTTITGGRRTGFRTFGYVTNPGSGAWVVELLSESGQLIGRTRFRVE